MTPENWQKLKKILHEASELPTRERRAYVLQSCGGDNALACQALSLLEEETTQTKTREGGPLRALFEKGDGHEYDGMEIGPYRVIRELGRGGMGVVLLASDSANGNREVAVKILRRGSEGRDTVLRFRHERIILSELDHPNIASLLDGGTTHEGLHYLVMEYINGQPIDHFCDSHRLDARARLNLFAKICDAMAYAHGLQVVHRDIKPGNILVTEDFKPVILDFGIAKMNNPESMAHAPLTATGQWLMTPEYASPEQVRGEASVPACDIYAMGMMLYELLTGHRPYQLQNNNPLELARIICEEDPIKPSKVLDHATSRQNSGGELQTTRAETICALRSTHPELLRRTLRGDLDRLIMTMLAKDARARYPNARILNEAIHSYLSGKGVHTSRLPLLSRAGKWLSRNKPILQAGYALLLVFGGFSSARLTAGAVPTQPVTSLPDLKWARVGVVDNGEFTNVHGFIGTQNIYAIEDLLKTTGQAPAIGETQCQ